MKKLWLGVCAAIALAGAPEASAQVALRPGVAAQGELSPDDGRLQSGEYRDEFTVQVPAGAVITASMESDQFDPYLMVRGPGVSEDNDDAPGRGRNAHLTVTAPQAGVFTIIATSFQPGERGAYRLRVDLGQSAASLPAAGPAAAATRLTLDRAVTGQLGPNDPAMPNGAFVDAYQIEGRAGQRFEISLASAALDPLLMIDGPGLNAMNDDDMERGTTDSRLVVTLPESGLYAIRASSYGPRERGNYQLIVRDVGAQPVLASASVAVSGASGQVLSLGAVAQGVLQQGDEALISGEWTDRYRFEGVAGQRVRITMTAQELDAYLMLIGPNGAQEENDDAAAGVTDSRLDAILSEDGVYTVVATTYRPGESGAYALSIIDLSRADGAPVIAAAPPPQSPAAVSGGAALTIDRPVSGRLAQGDARLRSGEFMDTYRFEGRRGQRATITLTSSEFDPYLMMVQPDGRQIENDDSGDGSLNSQIVQVLPEDGVYEVTVTSYQPGETGGYALTLGFEATGVAVNQQRTDGRIFAVLVGVSDYAGTANNLEFTAEDAVKLGETLELRGVLAPGSIVLTEAQATVSRVRQAFQQVAALAGPGDTFLFFFSGHGVQNRGQPSPTEPDGYEEAIVLRDGQISDNELAQWFGGVRSRVALLAIDACFAGGFARDVVSRPNVMGLFSSEEDLTSSVADKFRAGGYLSYFLRNGLAGDSDADGDEVITAGELSAYLRREFASEVTHVEATTTEGQRNYQFLVIDRGGVKIDDEVVALRS
ncbi:MAG: caspase family protein [Alphaproteobacteria bacterium]|nr:caspase family protein [Alphaproteobacteria bacterium]